MKLLITPILAVFLLMVGCHSSTTYVQSGPAGGAGYVDPYQNGGGYVDPYYDPLATIVVVGGSRGYYGPGHVFFPVVVVGGAEGYYDNNHRFVSSAPSVQQAVRDHKPMYAGPSSSATRVQTNNTTIVNNNGTAGRGPSASASTPAAARPNFGSQQGTAGRGPSSSTPAPTARPNFGSGAGSVGRGSSTPSPSRSSSSSSSSSAGRRH